MINDMNDKSFKMVVALAFLVVAAFMISMSLRINSNDKEFKIADMKQGTSYQMCTASIEAPFLYCNENLKKIAIQVNVNTTQAELDNWIKDCPNTIIMKGSVCVGNHLEVRGKK